LIVLYDKEYDKKRKEKNKKKAEILVGSKTENVKEILSGQRISLNSFK